MIPRAPLIAVGPLIAMATTVAALATTSAPLAFVVVVALVAGAALAVAGWRGGDVALAVGLGTVALAATATLPGAGLRPAMVLWTAGTVAAGEATGLARRTLSVAVPDAEVVRAELARSGLVVGLTVVGGIVLLGAGDLPGPGGLVGEIIALSAVIGLGALALFSSGARTAVRALVDRRPRPF